MTLLTKEAEFPAGYRQTQVRQVMRAVRRLRSIAITGLAGMGKSNLARFIVAHQGAHAQYLGERANDFVFCHVDGAGFRTADEAEVLDEMAAAWQNAGLLASGAQPLDGSQGARRRLQEHLLSIEPHLNLVVVFDYFDQASGNLAPSFYNFLFHLRNVRPRGNLAYIFVTRRSLGNLYELQELLDDDCVAGPFARQDALDSLRRDQARLEVEFNETQCDQLIACTGGHPGFLKNAAELLADGRVDTGLELSEMARQLLHSQKVTRLCRELWDDFTQSEREVLTQTARKVDPGNREKERAYLERNGILCRHEAQAAGIFCPLFELFVCDQIVPARPVHLTAVFPNEARIESALGAENIVLSPKLFALFKALTDAGGRVLNNDELITRIYGAQAVDISDAALSQLVRRLRDTLDPRVQELTGDRTYTCVETVRDVGYRLIR